MHVEDTVSGRDLTDVLRKMITVIPQNIKGRREIEVLFAELILEVRTKAPEDKSTWRNASKKIPCLITKYCDEETERCCKDIFEGNK